MRLVTDLEIAASAPARWIRQYKDWRDDRRFAQGHSAGETRAKIAELNGDYSPSNIEQAIGKSWAKPWCNWCNEWKEAVVTCDEADYTTDMCFDCARSASKLLRAYSKLRVSEDRDGEDA
jgi:hypothetical protein